MGPRIRRLAVRELWLVAKHEYLRRVREKSFLIAVIGFPVLILVVSVVTVLVTLGGGDSRPLGYVDASGLLDASLLPALAEDTLSFTEIQPYPDEDAARAALAAGEIQAFYVVPEEYQVSHELTLFFGEKVPAEGPQSDFQDFVEASLLARQPADVAAILEDGISLAIRTSDGQREMSVRNILGFLLPFIMTFFLFFAIAMAGGYLLEAVTEEKENRVVEIVTTSISPAQLMGGKALGLMSVSLTQILVWSLALVVGLTIATRAFQTLGTLTVPWEMLGLTVLFFLPTYVLIAGMMISIGAMAAEQQQGQQIAGIVNQFFLLPIYFVSVVFMAPDSPLLVLLSLFPTTSFLTVLLRWSLASVPIWQLVVGWILLVGTALTSVWLAARIFRMGMLRYGQRLSVKSVVAGLRDERSSAKKEMYNHA